MSNQEKNDNSNLEKLLIPNSIIQQHIPMKTKEKAFNITLPHDRYYHTRYDSTGRYMMVYNSTGSHSMFDVKTKYLFFDDNIDERINDGIFLHNEMYTALAQNKAMYIYNHGTEIQCVREMKHLMKMKFLNYHFLVVGLTRENDLKYFDTSIGKLISTINLNENNAKCFDNNIGTSNLNNNLKSLDTSTASKYFKSDSNISNLELTQQKKVLNLSQNKFGFERTMEVNKNNAIVHVGNSDGTVTLYKPSEKEFLMKIFCHKSGIKNIQIDCSGTYMFTNGNDNTIKTWDIRNNFNPINTINTPLNFEYIKLSQSNLLALGSKNKITILKDLTKSSFNEEKSNQNVFDIDSFVYMKEKIPGALVRSLEFCPYEDVLTVGHNKGFSNFIIPGCGDPNFDSFSDSPFRTKKQRQNLEITRLLEKIPYELISIDNDIIGSIAEKKETLKVKKSVPVEKKDHKRTALDRFYEK